MGGELVNPRILFVYQLPAPFILQDQALLARHAPVLTFRWSDHRRPARALARWMVRHRKEFDLVFVWFGDLHAGVSTRVAALLRKPSVLVVGGYDVSDVEGYGFLSLSRGRARARNHFRRATRILAVSTAVASELARQFPEAASKVGILPTGVDLDRFAPMDSKEPEVLSVAGAEEWKRAWIKGWDRIAEVARLLPDVPFRIIGAAEEVARRLDPPGNLRVLGPLDHERLIPEYQRAAVYVQASRSEGMPNTVMEAMACGCAPVVTRVGGMPELVADAGLVVEEDPAEIAEAVRRALADPFLGAKARTRVSSEFSLARREEGLLRTLREAMGASAA